MATDRRAEVTWRGSLLEGSGTIRSTTSGKLGEQPVSWVNRSEDNPDATSPEELIAAAHAACFSMALSAGLARAGTPPDELNTSATVTFQPGEGITKIALTVEGADPDVGVPQPRRVLRDRRGEPALHLEMIRNERQRAAADDVDLVVRLAAVDRPDQVDVVAVEQPELHTLKSPRREER